MAAPGGALVRARQPQLAANVWSTPQGRTPVSGGQMASPLTSARANFG
jgi:hypothetical protein